MFCLPSRLVCWILENREHVLVVFCISSAKCSAQAIQCRSIDGTELNASLGCSGRSLNQIPLTSVMNDQVLCTSENTLTDANDMLTIYTGCTFCNILLHFPSELRQIYTENYSCFFSNIFTCCTCCYNF